MQKLVMILLVGIMCLPVFSQAQSNYTPSELDTLVSNIALYPDPLLVHVLTATTYGEQIPAANAWAQAHKHLKGESLAAAMEEANLSYDPSVQALLPFPTVLEMLYKYKAWSDQLGDAVTSQKEAVMEAVQRMRLSAYDHGHLKSDDKVVVEKGENIVINPVRTEYVYVPVYNPRVVYYVYADGYTRVTYGSGVWLGSWYGEWGWGTCWFDWGPRIIYVRNTRWYAHRPIPHHPRRYVPPPRRENSFAPAPAPRPGHAGAAHVAPAPRASAAPAPRTTTAPAPRGTVAPAPAPMTATPAQVNSSRSVPAPRSADPRWSDDDDQNRRYESAPSRFGHDNDSRGNSRGGATSSRNGGFGKAMGRR